MTAPAPDGKPGRKPDRAALPAAFWSGVRAVGLTPAQVLAESGLPPAAIAGPRVSVSTDQLFAVWRAIEALHPAPDVGLRLVRGLDADQAHPIMLAALQARTFRDGLASLGRYKQLCSTETLQLRDVGDELAIEPDWPFATGPAPASMVDATFASLVELGRHGTGRPIRPRRVALRCPRDAAGARSAYFDVPVTHDAPRDVLVFAAADLALPFRTHNAELAEILAPQLERQLAQRQMTANTAAQVKRIVQRQLAGGTSTLVAVARDLGLSARTMQRRITEEGTTFRRIVDEARHELVQRYLADPDIGIAEAAYLLGYQDTNSFYRAFRGWEGTTPAHWREARRRPQ